MHQGEEWLCSNCWERGWKTVISSDYTAFDLIGKIKEVMNELFDNPEIEAQSQEQPPETVRIRCKDGRTFVGQLSGGKLRGTWQLLNGDIEVPVDPESQFAPTAPLSAFDKRVMTEFWRLCKRARIEDNVKCPFCQEVVKVPKIAECGHTFCRKCARVSTRDYDEYSCPFWCGGKHNKPTLEFLSLSPILLFVMEMDRAFAQLGLQENEPDSLEETGPGSHSKTRSNLGQVEVIDNGSPDSSVIVLPPRTAHCNPLGRAEGQVQGAYRVQYYRSEHEAAKDILTQWINGKPLKPRVAFANEALEGLDSSGSTQLVYPTYPLEAFERCNCPIRSKRCFKFVVTVSDDKKKASVTVKPWQLTSIFEVQPAQLAVMSHKPRKSRVSHGFGKCW